MRFTLAAGFAVFYLSLMCSCGHSMDDTERFEKSKHCVDAGMIPYVDNLAGTVDCRFPDKPREHK